MRLTVVVLILAGALPPAHAGTLQSYAFSQGGESTCGTFGPTAHMANDYMDGPSGKLYQFTPAAGCNVVQSLNYLSVTGPAALASSPLITTSSANASGIAGGGTFVGSSKATAAFGKLGVAALGNNSGLIDSTSAIGSESFATFAESFLLPGLAGSGGTLVLDFKVDGLFSTSGGAGAQFEMDYRIGAGPALMLYRIMATDSPPSLYYQGFVSSLPGLTVGPSSVTGSTHINLAIPFSYNVLFDYTIALFAGETPSSNHGLGGGSQGSVDFANTVTLVGITALEGGQPVSFTIQSGSGAVYNAQGVQSQAPEPAGFALFFAGLCVLAGWALHQRKRIHIDHQSRSSPLMLQRVIPDPLQQLIQSLPASRLD
jgi:hypothetical protein